MVTVPAAKCSPQYAPNVAEILKYPLNHVVADRFTVVNATVKSE